MTNQVSSRWANWSLWFWVARACVVGLVIADVSVAHPGPGLGGHHLVLLVGGIFAAAASLAYPLLERVGERVSALVLAAGVVGGCLAALVSPSSGALVLPALIAATAGASLSFPIAAGVAGCGLMTLGTSSIVVTSPGFSLLGSSLAVLGGLLAGLWRRQYVLRAEQAELMSVEAERAKEEHGRAKALDERARLAREIHDVLAHTLGGLVVQLDAADAVLGETGDSAKARRLVVSARRLAVEGLEETRRAIAALRLDPVALPDMLAALADSVGRDRWVHVTTKLTGIPRELAPDTSLAVYRTAQEALANARKHAPDSQVAVSLTYGAAMVLLRIANDSASGCVDAHALVATGGGYGLSGLKERAELLGGALRAGPSQGGWIVELRVPG